MPGEWVGSTRHDRLPRGWARLRRRILRRDPTCQACGRRPSTQVDHVTPGDDHSPANLQGVCAPCHAAKSATEGTAGRRAAGYQTQRRSPEPHPGAITPGPPAPTDVRSDAAPA